MTLVTSVAGVQKEGKVTLSSKVMTSQKFKIMEFIGIF